MILTRIVLKSSVAMEVKLLSRRKRRRRHHHWIILNNNVLKFHADLEPEILLGSMGENIIIGDWNLVHWCSFSLVSSDNVGVNHGEFWHHLLDERFRQKYQSKTKFSEWGRQIQNTAHQRNKHHGCFLLDSCWGVVSRCKQNAQVYARH